MSAKLEQYLHKKTLKIQDRMWWKIEQNKIEEDQKLGISKKEVDKEDGVKKNGMKKVNENEGMQKKYMNQKIENENGMIREKEE